MTAEGKGDMNVTETKIWWDFLDGLNISFLNWAMTSKDDINQKRAALTLGSGPTQVGDPAHWSESGKLVNARLQTYNNGWFGGGLFMDIWDPMNF